MAILDDIHNGLTGASSIIRNTSTFGKLDGRMIGNSNGSAELLTKVVSRQIGESLLGKMVFHTDMNCIRNPYSRRYETANNTGVGNFNFGLPDSPLIGQLYDVYYHEDDRVEFLDRTVAGDLMGYTHSQAAAEDRSENPFLDKLFAISTYSNFVEPELYLNDVPFWKNLNIGGKRYTPRDPYATYPLQTYPVHRSFNGEVLVFNNLFEIYDVESGPLFQNTELDVYEYTGTTISSYDGISNREYFYQENSKADVGMPVGLNEHIHAGNETFADVLDIRGDNLKNIKGLLHKTNKLFNDGKIYSLINRFKTDTFNGENVRTITNTAFDPIHGMSRGRNLTKVKPTTENGYENPYCRVWTSHHRYSKYGDLIRPFADTLIDDTSKAGGVPDGSVSEQYYTQGDGFRPFDGNLRLANMSVLDHASTGGKMPRPRFAPTYRQSGNMNPNDLKRCMFSIENLAWKDINFGAQVIGNGDKSKYTFGNTLTEEQRGPNGGRIMWFPPYNLKFSEQINAQWNENNFIGRGEAIKSYANTRRGGQLSFTLLVDHPMIVNQYSMNAANQEKTKEEQDLDLLRYFAGCGPLDIVIEKDKPVPYVSGTTYGDRGRDKVIETVTDIKTEEVFLPAEPEPDENEIAPDITFKVPFFYPNNYSGVDYGPEEAMDVLFNRGYRGRSKVGYEVFELNSTGLTYPVGLGGKTYTTHGGQWNGQHPWYFGKDRTDRTQSWYYAINGKDEKYLQPLPDISRHDERSYGLNYGAFGADSFYERVVNRDYLLGFSGSGVNWKESTNVALTTMANILGTHLKSENDPDMNYVLPSYFVYTGGLKEMIKLLESDSGITPTPKYKVIVSADGYASSHGHDLQTVVEESDAKSGGANVRLSIERARTAVNWFKQCSGLEVEEGSVKGHGGLTAGPTESSIESKVSRCAIVTVKLVNMNKATEHTPTVDNEAEKIVVEVPVERSALTESNLYRFVSTSITVDTKPQLNTYDNEYLYFKQINEGGGEGGEEFIKKYICDKVKYFDPAFHSITPEGFNARLTFLNQCTRQGPTIAATDDERATRSMGAGNLSFGRAPYCILRIGDFYYTKICIDNINIQYDTDNGIKWDLNPEGIGVQPMMANIDISFTFLGGSDLSGPIDRLQNAVSHNYYANTSVYDRRADYRDTFKDKDDLTYAWEPTMNGDDIAKDRSVHVKWSSDPRRGDIKQDELPQLGVVSTEKEYINLKPVENPLLAPKKEPTIRESIGGIKLK